MNVHVLIRERAGKTDVLGVVVDPVELAHLMYDPHAMPADAQLTEREAMLGADGLFYWAELSQMVAAPVFSLATHETTVADDDAFVASLTPERRARHYPDHRPEVERKAARAAMREARVDAAMLAKQNESNALALEVALEAVAAAPDVVSARAAVAMAAKESTLEAQRAKRAAKDKP